jgi:putative methyltransferase
MQCCNTYKIFIVNKYGSIRYSVPLLWASAKTYYEENSLNSKQWEWGNPYLNYNDIDKVLDELIKENPTVVGFSVYIWNELFSFELAKKLKTALPNTYIIWGGPQCDIKYNNDFFQNHPYIDLVAPSDAYGERSIADILDNITINNGTLVANSIQYCYWPDENLNVKFNSLGPNKKDFRWPKNPLRAQQAYIQPFLNQLVGLRSFLMIETSRGCPYKCSFCDWGGGTYTKTVKKEFATVFDELSWAGENNIDGIWFTDANFGMYDIDIEYIKHVISINKRYDYPKQVTIQPTKVKLDNLFKVYSLLADADMLSHYQISIQDLDDNVKKNVDRIDFSFEDQVAMFKKLQKQKYLPIWIEGILGLPGSSLSTIKDAIQRISLEKLPFPIWYHWILLPATPAYDPEYRDKFKLVTVKGKSSDSISVVIKEKPNVPINPLVSKATDTVHDTEYVVGSYSYSPKDWVEMNLLQIFTASTQNSQILDLISNYLWKQHQINYGELFDTVLNTLLYDTNVDFDLQQNLLKLKHAFDEWLVTDKDAIYCDYHNDFPFNLSPSIYFSFIILTDTDKFFDNLSIAISKLVKVDDKILDLFSYVKNRLLDISYRPGRIFTVRYDWATYIENGTLNFRPTTYQINDTQILTGGRWFEIDWMQYEGTIEYYIQYIYRVCYDWKSSKISKSMIEVDKLIN